MEETRKAKVKQRAEREQSKVLRFAQNATGDASVSTAAQQIIVNDIPFKITRGGSKLVRISSTIFLEDLSPSRLSGTHSQALGDPQTANATPKKATVAGVSFIRSKNGNLLRLGVVTSKKSVIIRPYLIIIIILTGILLVRPITAKKKDELCKRFSTTGIVFSDGSNPSAKPFEISKLTYSSGTCYKGPSCLYTHDPSKVAICKDFLQTGQCSAGNSCDLSHEPSPHRSPTCMHFLRERCSNPECRYAHIRVTPGAPVCRAFATLGYCEKGAKCEERHVHECPDYANDGVCHKKRCQLPHVDRAGQIRKAAAAAASKAEREDESDQSSEEEEYDAIDDDDVDSDEFDDVPEELIEGIDSGEMEQQQDFVSF